MSDARTGRAFQRTRKRADGETYTEATWTIGYDLDRSANGKRRQKIESGFKSEADARARLAAVLTDQRRGTYTEPARTTLGDWLQEWITTRAALKQSRPATQTRYAGIVDQIRASELATVPLQKIRESHLERYYATVTPGSAPLHHTVIRGALRKAWKEKLIPANPAVDMDHPPRPNKRRDHTRGVPCWSITDVRTFLQALDDSQITDPQSRAFFRLLLDAGCRKGEACALQWADVDLDAPHIRIERTLLKGGQTPVYGPPKNGQGRVVTITRDTADALRAHKREQATLKMQNRDTYKDHGLVFAKDWGMARSRRDNLGEPIQFNTLGERVFDPLTAAAHVPRITIHQIRHTVATLLLLAGEPPSVVADRLGHANVQTTLQVYSHVLSDASQKAARTMAAILGPSHARASQE